MKRILILAVVVTAMLFTSSVFAANLSGVAKLGIDFGGRHEIGPNEWDNKAGFTLGGEVYYLANENFDVGGGVQYQFSRDRKDLAGKYWFFPVYAAVRIHPPMTDLTPYGILQLGYNFYGGDSNYKGTADLRGGLYWGIGGGVIFQKHFLTELMYAENRGTSKTGGTSTDVKNSRISLSIGYNF